MTATAVLSASRRFSISSAAAAVQIRRPPHLHQLLPHRCQSPSHCPVPRRSVVSIASVESNERSATHTPISASSSRRTPLQQLEVSLASQLPPSSASSSSPSLSLPSSLAIAHQLLDVYRTEHKYEEAERLLWRLCDEQMRGESRTDEEAIQAICTLNEIVEVRGSALRHASRGGSSGNDSSALLEGALGLLGAVVHRYNRLTASASQAVIDDSAHFTFLQILVRAFTNCGEASKAEHVLRSTLLRDEERDSSRCGEAELDDGRRHRYAIAHYLLGIAAYPAEQPNFKADTDEHEVDREMRYAWSESEVHWKRALAYLDPFVARLSAAHTHSQSTSATDVSQYASDPLTMGLLHLWVATKDNISEAQFKSGEREAAMATLRLSIATMSALLPAYDPDLLQSRHRLIKRLLASDGGAAEAQKECAAILSLDPRLLSSRLTEQLDELAWSLFCIGQFEYAALFYQRSIFVLEHSRARESATLATKTATATRYRNLALCEIKLDRHKAAEGHLRISITMSEALQGQGHSQLAATVHNLAIALLGQEKFQEAETELRRAETLYEAMSEPEQPEHTSARREALLFSLGRCYAGMERWAESVTAYQRAVDEKQRSLGDHMSVVLDLTHLAKVLRQSGQFAQEADTFGRVRTMVERINGGEHFNVVLALLWLAQAEGRAGLLEEAVEHARQAMAIGERLQANSGIQLRTSEALKALKETLTELNLQLTGRTKLD